MLRNQEKALIENERDSTIASQPQVKRSEEGAQLLLPAESKIADGAVGVNATNNSGIKRFTSAFPGGAPLYVTYHL